MLGTQLFLGLLSAGSAMHGYYQANIAKGHNNNVLEVDPKELALYNAVRTYTFLTSFGIASWTSLCLGWRVDRRLQAKGPKKMSWCIASIPFSALVWLPATYCLGAVAGKKATETFSGKPLTTKNIIFFEIVSGDGSTANTKYNLWIGNKV
jgi:hypothetical protein